MLDTTTKQKIDSLRNLLVGKVPDPKSQVEQITVALFYKFMWDRDKEIKDLGGNATFFIGEFEKYSWENLFAPDLGGSECIKLYSEAIEEMENNPNIPSIFRDIFKRAFLPYNDPYTLRLFLKEINDFHYSNSEKLGDGFEYLLSILGTQGDAGQFRTPRHIIDFITEVVNPQKGDRIVDPACGTAGFIISAYKHILKTNTKESLGDLLTPEDKKRLGNNLVGLDIDPMMVKLALANMYLHGLNEPHIYEYDSLTSEERWDDMYDVVLANPPFMTPSGGIRPHKRFAVNATKAEVLFTSYINTHLSNNGRAGVVVPEGVIFVGENAYKELRKQLIESSLIGVVSLPQGVFNPYSPVKTSILILDKELNKKTDKIFFFKVENDGFSLGKKRKEIDKNDLPRISKSIKKYCDSLRKELKENQSNLGFVSKDEILNSSEISLSFQRYEVIESKSKNYEMVLFGDVCDFQGGNQPPKEQFIYKPQEGYLRFIQIRDFGSRGKETFIPKSIKNKICYAEDVLIGRYGASVGKICSGLSGAYNVALIKCINDKKRLNNKFLFHLLNSTQIQKKIIGLSARAAQAGLNPKHLRETFIPLPSLEIQKDIVEELEQCQKIIDGAKQVVDNYKPHFEIDDNWDKVELGEVGKISMCKRIYKDQTNSKDGVPFYKIGTFGSKPNAFISRDLFEEYKARFAYPKKGEILISTSGTIGKTVEFDGHDSYFQDSNIVWISNDESIVMNSFLKYYYHIINWNPERGVTIARLYNKIINRTQISVPKIDVQQQIVERLDSEKKIIEGNKKLIEIYSKKIENRINKIWGELFLMFYM